MARVCIQCDKSIGFFKKAIDGVFCSYECRTAARDDIAKNEERAKQAAVEAEHHKLEEERAAADRVKKAAAAEKLKNTCPKCGQPWQVTAGEGEAFSGSCRCGFNAELVGVESCPTCRGESLVVYENGEARCPRCKHRRDG